MWGYSEPKSPSMTDLSGSIEDLNYWWSLPLKGWFSICIYIYRCTKRSTSCLNSKGTMQQSEPMVVPNITMD